MTTEQAHAAGAVLMRVHKQYGHATISDRSSICHVKPLLTESAPEGLLNMMDRLKRKNPNNIGARQAWLSALIKTASKKHSQCTNGSAGKFYPKKVVQWHEKLWSSMRVARKASFAQEAERRQEDAGEADQARISDLAMQIDSIRQARSECDGGGALAVRLDTCRVSPGPLEELQGFFESFHMSSNEVMKQRVANKEPKGRPAQHVLDTPQHFDDIGPALVAKRHGGHLYAAIVAASMAHRFASVRRTSSTCSCLRCRIRCGLAS